jgi:hypothetical protein
MPFFPLRGDPFRSVRTPRLIYKSLTKKEQESDRDSKQLLQQGLYCHAYGFITRADLRPD